MNDAPHIHVGFVIDDLGIGGDQSQLVVTCRHLPAALRASVFVLSDRLEPFAQPIRDLGIEVHPVPRKRSFELGRSTRLAAAMKDAGIDLVHSCMQPNGYYCYRAAHKLGVPLVLALRSDRLGMDWLRTALIHRAMRAADAVVANSVAGRTYLLEAAGVAQDNAYVIPNIFDPDSAPQASGESIDVVFVGRLVALKRVDLLLRAFQAVIRNLPAHLHVVGDGPEREHLEQLVGELNLSGRVRFHGAISDPLPLVADCGALALVSEYEATPVSIVEALSCGVPVVSTNVGDVNNLIPRGLGIVCDDDSPETIADAITQVLTDSTFGRNARSRGPAGMRDRFGADTTMGKWLRLYQHLMNQQKSGAP